LDHRLRIVRPVLPDFVDELELRDLRIGGAETDLQFRRKSKSRADVEVLRIAGPLEVLVEQPLM
jgi:hypothetical protein